MSEEAATADTKGGVRTDAVQAMVQRLRGRAFRLQAFAMITQLLIVATIALGVLLFVFAPQYSKIVNAHASPAVESSKATANASPRTFVSPTPSVPNSQ